MLRKLSRKLSHRPENKRQASPEFVSLDAARIEKQHQTATIPRRSWEQGDESSFYTNQGLEALQLEPIIAPTLTRMAPMMSSREALTPPPLRVPEKARVLRGKPPRLPLPVRLKETDLVILSEAVPGITVTPAQEHDDPFEHLDKINELQMTSFPVRPVMRRKAVSYRSNRELPLRVQAIRRAHQEEFSRKLAERPPINASQRRGSLPVRRGVPEWLEPVAPLTTSQSLRHTRSEANLQNPPQRSQSSGSRRRSPIPDVPLEQTPRAAKDFYIEAAAELWQIPSPPALADPGSLQKGGGG